MFYIGGGSVFYIGGGSVFYIGGGSVFYIGGGSVFYIGGGLCFTASERHTALFSEKPFLSKKFLSYSLVTMIAEIIQFLTILLVPNSNFHVQMTFFLPSPQNTNIPLCDFAQRSNTHSPSPMRRRLLFQYHRPKQKLALCY